MTLRRSLSGPTSREALVRVERMNATEVRGELRDGEVELAPDRVVDKPLVDQPGATDRKLARAHAHVPRDVCRGVAAVAEVGHRGHVNLFSLGRLLVAVAEEATVQLVVDQLLSDLRVVEGDRRSVSLTPNGLPPLLQEVRVSISSIKDEFQSVLVEAGF
jgi:hypothetical protein